MNCDEKDNEWIFPPFQSGLWNIREQRAIFECVYKALFFLVLAQYVHIWYLVKYDMIYKAVYNVFAISFANIYMQY